MYIYSSWTYHIVNMTGINWNSYAVCTYACLHNKQCSVVNIQFDSETTDPIYDTSEDAPNTAEIGFDVFSNAFAVWQMAEQYVQSKHKAYMRLTVLVVVNLNIPL